MFIAHRGLVTKTIKENTIEAFKAAIDDSRYAGFELDIRVSKDKEFVVYHDLTYKGKLVKNILYKDMKKDKIPRLIDVLNLETDKIIMIEIKDFDLNLKKLAKLLNKYNHKKLYISSFSNKVIKEIKKYLFNIKVGSLNYILNSEEDYSKMDFICIINYCLTKDLIDYFKLKNMDVFSYGVTSKNKIEFNNIYYIINDEIL